MPHVNHRRETVQKARATCRRGRHYIRWVTWFKDYRSRRFRRHTDWILQKGYRDADMEDLHLPRFMDAVKEFWVWD